MDEKAAVKKYGCPDCTNNGIIIQVCKDGSRLTLPAGIWVANNGQFFLCSKCRKEDNVYHQRNLYITN